MKLGMNSNLWKVNNKKIGIINKNMKLWMINKKDL